jgi:hypothetical protein
MHHTDINSAVLALFAMALILAIAEYATRSVRHAHSDGRDGLPRWVKSRLEAKLSSKGLADLIVQALVDSKIIAPDKSQDATEIAARKIDLRKALGDY